MKRAGKPAGHDFGDNRVPGAGQRVRECLTERPELDNRRRDLSLNRNVLVAEPLACGSRRGRGRLGYSKNFWIIIQIVGREYCLILVALTNMVSFGDNYDTFVNQRTSFFNIRMQNS